MQDYEYIQAKSILSKLRNDPYFGISYNMNIYRGCQHGCIYCDTRSECYGVGDISRIRLKQNAPDLLTQELRSKRNSKGTIGTGSMNDPYMPVEKETGMIRKALQIISEAKFPVHIITKSNLVLRDMDVLKEISKTYSAVSFTITTFDDRLAAKIEPNAPSTSERFGALYQLSKNGIYTGITLMPLLPFINDTESNLRQIVQKAKDCGARYIVPMFGLTLRKGSREYFYKSLDDKFDGMRQQYETKFGQQYECMSSNYQSLKNILSASDIPRRMEFYKPYTPEQLSLF